MLLASAVTQVFASLSPQHSYPHSNIHTSILSQITRFRGGEGEGSSTPPPETTYNQYAAQNQQQMANPNFQQPPTNDPMYEYRETVEDRIDAWRKEQLVSDYNMLLFSCSTFLFTTFAQKRIDHKKLCITNQTIIEHATNTISSRSSISSR